MKILEITEYSAGICGVWQRVKQESEELVKKGNEVYVFSSDIEKGTNNKVPKYELTKGIKIFRFPVKKRVFNKFSENVNSFEFCSKFNEIKPDIVITHLIHPHSFKALTYSEKRKIPCYLVTHAPFNVKRSPALSLLTKMYYSFKVSKKIKRFSKIITITKWEIPYLNKLGIKKEKIIYIPNYIPNEFFKEKIKPFSGKKILFLGRIAPIKDLETLIRAFKIVNQKNKKITLEITGPIEKPYGQELFKLIKKLQLTDSIKFIRPIYDLNKKIKKIGEADIFVLPSKREAMPQAIIEAMSLGKIVIASSTSGAQEIIENHKNGFLFQIGNYKELAEILSDVLSSKDLKNINQTQKNARKTSEQFKISHLIDKLERLIHNK